MRRTLAMFLIISLVIMTVPMLAVFNAEQTPNNEITKSEKKNNSGETVNLFLENEKTVVNLSLKDYLTGVLFAEMDCEYEIEALKAQAVASYTYYLYNKKINTKKPDTVLMGAYISDNPAHYQAYMKSDDAKKKFGDKYQEYYSKISKAVDSVLGEYMTYHNDVILAVFHSYNGGKTENAKDVWGKDYKYLKSVESKGDLLSPAAAASVNFSIDEFKNKFSGCKGVDLNKSPSEFIGEIKHSNAGTVTEIIIGGKTFSGNEIRNLLSLKSSNFTAQYSEKNGFTLNVLGYGHNVGMSQYGADYMARQGAAYDEILKHYYSGIKIVKN